MRVIIVYATNSGSTYTASTIIADVFQREGHTVILKPVAQSSTDDINKSDLVILGSCTWQRKTEYGTLDGQLPEHFFSFIKKMEGQTFSHKKFAVFGCGDPGYAHFCAAADHLTQFVKDVQGTLVDESLKIGGFYFNYPENAQKVHLWAHTIAQAVSRKHIA